MHLRCSIHSPAQVEQQKLLLAVGVEIEHQGSWDVYIYIIFLTTSLSRHLPYWTVSGSSRPLPVTCAPNISCLRNQFQPFWHFFRLAVLANETHSCLLLAPISVFRCSFSRCFCQPIFSVPFFKGNKLRPFVGYPGFFFRLFLGLG